MENVLEHLTQLLEPGVIVTTKIVTDEEGNPVKDPETGRVRRIAEDPKQVTVWNAQYRQRGNARVNIEFPDNENAEEFESILTDAERAFLFQLHRPLLDEEGNMIPLPDQPEKFQRGFFHLAIVCRKAKKLRDEDGKTVRDKRGEVQYEPNPRDQMYDLICERIPDLPEYEHIVKGEEAAAYLTESVGEETTNDLFSKLTYMIASGDRVPAEHNQVIFLKASSGFDALWVNPTGSMRDRQAREPAEPPETETATAKDIFGTEDS